MYFIALKKKNYLMYSEITNIDVEIMFGTHYAL